MELRECKNCGKASKFELCKNCSTGKIKEQRKEIDLRGGCCHYEVDGEYCVLAGSMSHDTLAKTTKWYCCYHLNCNSKDEGRKIMTWAKQYFREINITRQFSILYSNPKPMKPVILLNGKDLDKVA